MILKSQQEPLDIGWVRSKFERYFCLLKIETFGLFTKADGAPKLKMGKQKR